MIRDYKLPEALETVNASAYTILAEIELAINSAILKSPHFVPMLMQIWYDEMICMASVMFTAGKIAGVRQERSKQRRRRVKMEVVINA